MLNGSNVQEVQCVKRKVQEFKKFKGSRSSKFESRGYFRELDGFIRINVLLLGDVAEFQVE